jgi:hypothetical protein
VVFFKVWPKNRGGRVPIFIITLYLLFKDGEKAVIVNCGLIKALVSSSTSHCIHHYNVLKVKDRKSQGLGFAKKVLYHLSHAPVLFLL